MSYEHELKCVWKLNAWRFWRTLNEVYRTICRKYFSLWTGTPSLEFGTLYRASERTKIPKLTFFGIWHLRYLKRVWTLNGKKIFSKRFLNINKISEHFFTTLSISRNKREGHTKRGRASIAGNVCYKWFLNISLLFRVVQKSIDS